MAGEVPKPPARKRRRSGAQGTPGDAAPDAGPEAEDAGAKSGEGSDHEFFGSRKQRGKKVEAFTDREGRRNEITHVDIVPKICAELPEADEEVRPPVGAITHSDALIAPAGEEDDDFGEDSWRPGLEELRRRFVRPEHTTYREDKPLAEELVVAVRTAIRDGNWQPVLDPARWPLFEQIRKAVEELEKEELLHVLKVCGEQHIQHPWMETWCLIWADQVISAASLRLAGWSEFREATLPLLQLLSWRLGSRQKRRGVAPAACVGRWRLVLELARVRRKAAGPAKAPTGARAEAGAAVEAPESSEEEQEEEAGDAAPKGEGGGDDSAEEDDDEEAEEGAADGKDVNGADPGIAAEVAALKKLAGARAGAAANGPRGLPRKRSAR